MQIFVRSLSGKPLTIGESLRCGCGMMADSDSVASIKQAIAAKTAIPVDEQRLLFAGKDLIDAVPFEAYGLQAENTLDLLIRSVLSFSFCLD
jgi:large subunit ribosomal protein L40e